jgi:hypothetical protein
MWARRGGKSVRSGSGGGAKPRAAPRPANSWLAFKPKGSLPRWTAAAASQFWSRGNAPARSRRYRRLLGALLLSRYCAPDRALERYLSSGPHQRMLPCHTKMFGYRSRVAQGDRGGTSMRRLYGQWYSGKGGQLTYI